MFKFISLKSLFTFVFVKLLKMYIPTYEYVLHSKCITHWYEHNYTFKVYSHSCVIHVYRCAHNRVHRSENVYACLDLFLHMYFIAYL